MQNFDYCQLKRGIIPASVCKGLISEKHCTLKSFFALFSTVYKKVLNFPIIANFPGWPLPKPVGNYRVTTVVVAINQQNRRGLKIDEYSLNISFRFENELEEPNVPMLQILLEASSLCAGIWHDSNWKSVQRSRQ